MSGLQLRFTAPDPTQIKQGIAYTFIIISTPEDLGSIYDKHGVARWRYETDPPRPSHSALNIFRKPDFVLLDSDGKEVLRIARKQRFPGRFMMIQGGRKVGGIARRGVFRNKYSLAVQDDIIQRSFPRHFQRRQSCLGYRWTIKEAVECSR